MPITTDISLSAVIAGFIAVLVGFASAMAIVFQAATAAGATPQMLESWVWALGWGMGGCSFALSWYYKKPIIIAWSTPGAALLATTLSGIDMATAIGIFVCVGLLTALIGVSGMFAAATRIIPLPLASAMLAGILIQFGFELFTSFSAEPTLVGVMLLGYLVLKRISPRFAIAGVLLIGLAISYFSGKVDTSLLSLSLASPVWVTPAFDWPSIIGIGIPLFIVTMTSQNLPGVATLQASGYAKQPVSPIITSTGLATIILAPFGGFSFNLAAITAAICTSPESHPDPAKRYIAGLSCGLFNILAAIFGTAVVSLFIALPHAMVAALAGLALLGTIAVSLKSALADQQYMESAVITLLVTASGMSLFGVGSAFWGILLGMLSLMFTKIAK